MIIDLKKFIAAEKGYWDELSDLLKQLDDDPYRKMDYRQIRRLYYLYQRASADLARISTFSAEKQISGYLETLVARAYAKIHGGRQKKIRFAPLAWFMGTFPRAFRRNAGAFFLSVAVFLVGCVFGASALVMDSDAKAVLMPFDHLQVNPAQRVAEEEKAASGAKDRLEGHKTTFSAFLMTHNTRVSILVLALGMTWGIGTVVLLFSNGVMLGAVAGDYVINGQTAFLMGWLLPHGVVEIPAILVAGQAGLMLAGALIGRRSAEPLGDRVRRKGPDIVHLIGGVAIMLVWAGFIEAFFSQYHEPVLPYALKIGFGVVELCLLAAFLGWAGKGGALRARRRTGEAADRRRQR